MNDENKFEDEWNKFIEEYGNRYGMFYNGFERRKKIAKFFYATGCLHTLSRQRGKK